MATETKRRFAGPFILFAVWIFFLIPTYPQWRDFERLAHSGLKTEGKIIALEPADHNRVRYQYTVNKQTYERTLSTQYKTSNSGVGQEVPIIYRADRPSVSVAGDIREIYQSWTFLLFIALPGVGALAAWSILHAHKTGRLSWF